MNKILKEQFKFFKYFSKMKIFYLLVVSLFLLVFGYCGLLVISHSSYYSNFFDLNLSLLSDSRYFLLLLFIFLISTIAIFNTINNNNFIKIRHNNKKEFLKSVLITVLFQNAILFLLELFFLFIYTSFFSNAQFSIDFLSDRNTYNIIYFIFFILRFLAWIEIISTIEILLFYRISPKIAIIISISIIFSFLFIGVNVSNEYIIRNIGDISFNIFYFLYPLKYSSFLFEISISLLYICVFCLILRFLLFHSFKNDYLKLSFQNLKNDIFNCFKFEKNLIIFYFVIILLFTIYFYIGRDIAMNIIDFKNIFGLNSSSNILIMLILLYHQFFLAYLSFKVIINNIKLSSSTLILRIKPKIFLSIKLISLLSFATLIKLLSYILVYFIFMFTSTVTLADIIPIFITDLLFSLVVMVLNLFSLFWFYGFNNNKVKYFSFAIVASEFYLFHLPFIDYPNIIWLAIILLVSLGCIKIFEKKFCSIYEGIEIGG